MLDHEDLVEGPTTAAAFLAWRLARRWNQPEAARQLGLTERTVRRYETGACPVPRSVQLACWALRAQQVLTPAAAKEDA